MLASSYNVKETLGAHQVDVIAVAATAARLNKLLKPVKTLASVTAVGDGRQRFLGVQRVDVLLVPLHVYREV